MYLNHTISKKGTSNGSSVTKLSKLLLLNKKKLVFENIQYLNLATYNSVKMKFKKRFN